MLQRLVSTGGFKLTADMLIIIFHLFLDAFRFGASAATPATHGGDFLVSLSDNSGAFTIYGDKFRLGKSARRAMRAGDTFASF